MTVSLAILLLAVCGLGYGVMELDGSKLDRVDTSSASGEEEAAEIAKNGIDPRFLADKIRDLEDKIKRLESETAELRKNARSGPSLPGLGEVFGGGKSRTATKDGQQKAGAPAGGGNNPLNNIRKLVTNFLGGGDPKNMTPEERKAREERLKQIQQWRGRRGGRSRQLVDQFVRETSADLNDEQRKAMAKTIDEQLKAVAARRDKLRKDVGGNLSREQEENIRFEARQETDRKLAAVLEPDQLSDFVEWRRERDERRKAEEQRRQENRRRRQENTRAQTAKSAGGLGDSEAPGDGQGR